MYNPWSQIAPTLRQKLSTRWRCVLSLAIAPPFLYILRRLGADQETYLMKANSLMIAAALFLTITLPAALDPPDVIVGSDQDNMSEVAEWYV